MASLRHLGSISRLRSLSAGSACEKCFLLYLLALPVMHPGTLSVQSSSVYAADFIFAATAVAWMWALARREMRFCSTAAYFPLALYFLACILSTVFSEDPRRSATKLLIDTYMISIAVLTFNIARSSAFFRRVSWAWLAGTAVTVVVGLLGVVLFYVGLRNPAINITLAGYGSLPAGNYPRVSGLFLNFNMCCNYLSISLLFALLALRLGWLSRRAFWWLAGGLLVMCAFTVSPGIGGMLLGAGLWYWIAWDDTRLSHWRKCALLVGLVAACVFFLATLISPRPTGREGIVLPILHARAEPSSRLLCWEAALRMWKRYPVWGRGTGLEMPCIPWEAAGGDFQFLEDAHNMYLNVAALKGTIGLLALLTIILHLIGKGFPLSLNGSAILACRTMFAIAFLEAFVYQGLSGSFEHTRHLWVLIGLMMAAKKGPEWASDHSNVSNEGLGAA